MTNNYIEAVRKGHTYIPNFYLLDNRLLDGEKTLLSLLQASCFGDKIETYPSQKTLGEALKKSIRTIQRHIKHLKELGYIQIKRRGSISNCYKLLIKDIKQKVEKGIQNIKKAASNNKNYTKKESIFTGYNQRNYNFKILEEMLLGNKDYNSQEILLE